MNIIIIGAGIGGLSAGCLLAKQGHDVTILEKNDCVGGKMNEIEADGFRFDTGPSLFTMPYILDRLLKECGTSLSSELDMIPLDINCRYFFQDGMQFDNYSDRAQMLKEIRRIAPSDEKAYIKFLDYATSLDKKTRDAFILNPLYSFSDLKNLNLFSFFGIDAFTTVSERVDSRFSSPYLRQFFKRFTTYNGSSPFQAPATLNVIPHIELNEGGYYIKGGLYRIAECLRDLALSLNVTITYNTKVDRIHVLKEKIKGIETESGTLTECDLVVANSDASETILNLIDNQSISPKRKENQKELEPSCSGFVMLLGIDKQYKELIHHNIFFSSDYEREFEQIFKEKVMTDDPTIYIANTSFTDTEHAPEGHSNLFVLVNAPYLSDSYDWTESEYGDKVIRELEQRGLKDLRNHILFRDEITPKDFYEKYLSNKGSIYGTSSNDKFSAFLRPRNKSREIEGLYFVGGSTHPGGGIPLVVQSAINAVELIERFE
ncbi:MAG: phytoene desaturase family protein [Balneola sp.]